MMIPTSGASTSISSNAASTSGIGSAVATSGAPPGSAISIAPSPCRLSGFDPFHGALGDIAAYLHALEQDLPRGIVRPLPGAAHRRAQAGHVQDPPARGHELAIATVGTRVGHLHIIACRGLLDAGDYVPGRGGAGIPGRGEDHRHGPILAKVGDRPAEATRLPRSEAELQEVRPQARQDRLGLRVT